MNLDYEKIKRKREQNGSHWTSYSDLFMALSFLFLLLYVVASFRTGTVTHSAKLKLVDMEDQQRQLQQQIRIYERVSNNYVEEDATPEEKQLYEKVINRLDLLKSDAESKQRRMQAELERQRQREQQLNEYQKTVKNLINANLNASRDVKERERKLAQRARELVQMEANLQERQRELQQKEEVLTTTKGQLQASRQEVEESQQKIRETNQKIRETAEKYESRIAQITEENRQQLEKLQKEYQAKQEALQKKTEEVNEARQVIAKQEQENRRLIKMAKESQAKSQQKIQQLKAQREEMLAKAKEKFEAKLQKERMSAQEKLAAEREYRNKVQAEKEKFNQALKNLEGELQSKQARMSELKQRQQDLAEKNSKLAGQLENAKGDAQNLSQKLQQGLAKQREMEKALAKARKKANRRRNISKKIADSFRNSGLDVDVNPDTGDLILNFGDEYFDTGKYFLKSGMRKVLNKAVPLYAQTLFEDDDIAKHISTIELVGFASPTYRDRVVDPRSLAPRDRKAINYNLDLSYKRARAIFKYVFNTNKIKYQYQSRLLPMVKVTGRSFFTEDIKGKNPKSINMKEFCERYDCNRSQKVIVRFNLKD
jgi:chromosome segregation ATPase